MNTIRRLGLAAGITLLSAIVLAQDAGKFTDKRDGKTYKKVTIGKQVWMAENLNYAANGGKCYKNDDANCAQYGRLYDWKTALKACPAGWHLPTDKEWTVLENTIGDSKTAGTRLKSTSCWNNNGNGTDEFGFSALPGGYGSSDGGFGSAGDYGYWWSATGYDADEAWCRVVYYDGEYVDRGSSSKSYLFAVRCAQDTGEQK